MFSTYIHLRKKYSSFLASAFSLILAVTLLAYLAIPGYAEEHDSASDYRVIAMEVDRNANPLPSQSPVTAITQDDLHGYILTVTGAASSGYCRISVASGSDKHPQYWYLAPVSQGETVYLLLQVASGATVTFDAFSGEPAADISSDRLIAPTEASIQGKGIVPYAYVAASKTPFIQYFVPERVSLETVAGHYGISPRDILSFNGIDSIAPGNSIRIPNPATETPYEPAEIYVVVEGDTLQGIADGHNVPLKTLCQWNDLRPESTIYPGLELEIPILYENTQAEPEETQPRETQPEETVHEESEFETLPPETFVEEVPAERVQMCGVPRYFQNDYPNDRYADGTIATSGCSVTSLTMVANAITGYDYTVDELGEYFGGRAENNMQRLEIGSETLGLSFYKSENWHYTLDALKEGAIVIALMEENSLFTDSQHFIVLTGLSEDGERIYVNDPNAANYDLWNLKNGFANGFKPEDILLGYSGAWVYQRTLEEIPQRYSEPRLSRIFRTWEGEGLDPEVEALIAASNYPEIRLTMEERDLLAKVIWAEARGECAAGQQAIAEVVLNRLLSEQFGDDLKDVIYSEGQFRSVDKLEEAEPTQAQYQAIERAFFGTPVLNRNVLYFATYRTNDNVYMMIGNHIFCY